MMTPWTDLILQTSMFFMQPEGILVFSHWDPAVTPQFLGQLDFSITLRTPIIVPYLIPVYLHSNSFFQGFISAKKNPLPSYACLSALNFSSLGSFLFLP